MAIDQKYRPRYVYHFTHLENLPQILETGLLSHNELTRLGKMHTSVAYDEIQGRRSNLAVTCGPGGVVHDYVPFYFCKRSSMLFAVVNNKIADQFFIIYLRFPITIMEDCPCVFTDTAANTSTSPNFYNRPEDLDNLNWEAIDSQKWSLGSVELNHQRMAELLVHKNIGMDKISRIIVWNESIRERVLKIYEKAGIAPPSVGYDSHHYCTSFFRGGGEELHSIVKGPYAIAMDYKETIGQILPAIGKASSPRFDKLSSLLKALREDFSVLPETAELVGLESDNEMHTEDVGKHTLNAVCKLLTLPEYEAMNPTDKLLVELATYFHDIGKGPKSQWEKHGGKQQVDPDHAVKALPMVKRILTEDVKTLKNRSAKVICKLVCYHDLVGDIVGKGRRPKELFDVVEDSRDLEMLIAISKADMLSVNPLWLWESRVKIEALHAQALKDIKVDSDQDTED